MSETIVRLENVVKHYRVGRITVRAIQGISLEIRRGDFIAVMGPSGSGKTTLFNLIGCLDKPTEGTLFFEEEDTSALSANRLADLRNARIGFVFQHFNLVPVLTAFENVELPLLLRKMTKKERSARVTRSLKLVGLADKIDRRPVELSGGEQQRVAIARALALRPEVILADEPTGNLDSATAMGIVHLMKDVNEQEGTTFVFSTHDPTIVGYATRIVEIRDGLIRDQ